MEMVEFDECLESMTDAELEAFGDSFPIEECEPKATDIGQ